MTNPMQPLDPAGAPPPVTPADSASNPAGYAEVTPTGRGPAPYDIQAPMGDLTAAVADAGALAGAGIVYPQGPRQAATQVLLDSAAGFSAGHGTSGYDIQQGYSGAGGDGWPNSIQPPEQQGYVYPGAYPGTVQGDVPDYGG